MFGFLLVIVNHVQAYEEYIMAKATLKYCVDLNPLSEPQRMFLLCLGGINIYNCSFGRLLCNFAERDSTRLQSAISSFPA